MTPLYHIKTIKHTKYQTTVFEYNNTHVSKICLVNSRSATDIAPLLSHLIQSILIPFAIPAQIFGSSTISQNTRKYISIFWVTRDAQIFVQFLWLIGHCNATLSAPDGNETTIVTLSVLASKSDRDKIFQMIQIYTCIILPHLNSA